MRKLAAWSHDRRRTVLGLWFAAFVVAIGLWVTSAGEFVNNFNLPGTESQRTYDLLQERFPQQSGDTANVVFAVKDERTLRFPAGRTATNYVLGLEDVFFVYPTKLRQYQARYRGSFLHGGISPEEMILPVALLTPR